MIGTTKKQLRFMGKSYDYDDTDSEVVIIIGKYTVRVDSWDASLVLRGSVLLTAGGRSKQTALTALERKIERIAAIKQLRGVGAVESVEARRKDGGFWRIEPDGVNLIEIDTCQVNDIGQAFGQSASGVFHGFTKAPPGTYRVLLERIGD